MLIDIHLTISRCLADQRDLDSDEPSLHRCEKHRELLVEELKYGKLWEEYGIVGDLVVSVVLTTPVYTL